ncbi:MAG: GH3 auxin-responsive promoter family protein [Rhodospirillaceae bacterium]|nr:GH3 auxin-responsive promoter family protein [Rhodospirillaceae bacterium]
MLDTTPLLRLYATRRRRHLAMQAPAPTQERQLAALLRRAAGTVFGRRHGFARLRGVADFQAAVPLRRYEDFWHEFWAPAFPVLEDVSWPGRIPYFAVTSGTTSGKTKHIPVSHAMVAANRRGALDVLTYHLANRPCSHVLAGRSFMLGGSTALTKLAPGVLSGDLSGIAADRVPFWARPRFFPPRQIALIADWDRKIATLAPLSLAADIRAIGGTPSWLLLFFEALAALRPEAPPRLASWYPRLELLIHGGVNFAPYRRRFEALLEGSRAELREVYPASEGFVAIADRGPDDGLRLILDNGLFYEFVPVGELDAAAPTRHWIATAETGVDYALVLSSCAGLWAYVLGDTVRLVERAPPRLVVTGRTAYMLSAFGEHLIAEEIEDAVAAAAESIGCTVNDYVAAPLYPEPGGARGGHLFVVELAERVPGAEETARFAAVLDRTLAAANDDYAAHRAGGFGMDPPAVRPVPAGTFAAWMRTQGRLGGQHKVPRVLNDPARLRELLAFLDAR